jgi:hypothetical protein
MLIAVCAIATALAAITLAWIDVELFDSLALEDSIVEWSSALFLFGGGVVMLAAAFTFDFRKTPIAFAAALGLGFLLLLIGLEGVRTIAFGVSAACHRRLLECGLSSLPQQHW